MLQPLKVPYFPNAQLYHTQSPLGAMRLIGETDIYLNCEKLERRIVRVDCLSALEMMWGKEIFRSRPLMITLLTGFGIGEDNYRKLVMSYYRRFKAFADYVDENILFGDPNQSFVTNLIAPIREILNAKEEAVVRELTSLGGKILITGDEYVYAAFKRELPIPNIQGLEVVSK